MGKSLDDRAKKDKLKAIIALADGLDIEDGVVPVFTLEKQGVLNAVEILAEERYAEKTQRTILGGQTIPAYIITKKGVRYYNRI